MTLRILATTTLATFCLSSAMAAENGRSVTSSPALVGLLGTMSELASEGASLEYFGYTENAAEMVASSHCEVLPGTEVVKWFTKAATELLQEWEQTPDATALQDFASVVGQGSYRHCWASRSGGRSLSHFDSFKAQDGRFSIQFEFGYED